MILLFFSFPLLAFSSVFLSNFRVLIVKIKYQLKKTKFAQYFTVEQDSIY